MTGRHEGGGGELPFEPDARQLVDRLQAFISENEVAAELAVQAVEQLSWEQLQTVQVKPKLELKLQSGNESSSRRASDQHPFCTSLLFLGKSGLVISPGR